MKSVLTRRPGWTSTSTPMLDGYMQHSIAISTAKSDIHSACQARWMDSYDYLFLTLTATTNKSDTICVRVSRFFRVIGTPHLSRSNHSRRPSDSRGLHCKLHLQEVYLISFHLLNPLKRSSSEESTNSFLRLKNLSFLAFRQDHLPYQPTRR